MKKKEITGYISIRKEGVLVPLDRNDSWPGGFRLTWGQIGVFACRLHDKPGHHAQILFSVN